MNRWLILVIVGAALVSGFVFVMSTNDGVTVRGVDAAPASDTAVVATATPEMFLELPGVPAVPVRDVSGVERSKVSIPDVSEGASTHPDQRFQVDESQITEKEQEQRRRHAIWRIIRPILDNCSITDETVMALGKDPYLNPNGSQFATIGVAQLKETLTIYCSAYGRANNAVQDLRDLALKQLEAEGRYEVVGGPLPPPKEPGMGREVRNMKYDWDLPDRLVVTMADTSVTRRFVLTRAEYPEVFVNVDERANLPEAAAEVVRAMFAGLTQGGGK